MSTKNYLSIFLLMMTTGAFAQAFLSENHYKSCQARQVYQQLLQSAGSDYRQPPELKISKSASMVAFYDPEGFIILEERAYDVCMDQPDSLSALAWVIGHEFSHFFQKHDEKDDRMRALLETTSNHPIQYFQEREADIVGAFYSLLAGFEPAIVLDNLFEELYGAYQLTNATLANYRALPERKKSAQEAFQFAEKLWLIHETAGYFVALGNYDSALDYYLFLLDYMECPEWHNNIALTYLQYAVSTVSNNGTPDFLYPFELANNERLEVLLKRDDFQKEWQQLAARHLKKALVLDPLFFSAHLNELCLLLLKKDYSLALRKADELGQTFQSPREKALINIIKGIAFARRNQKEEAALFFKKAQHILPSISNLALNNLNMLKRGYLANVPNTRLVHSPKNVIKPLEDIAFSFSELGEEIYISNFSDKEHPASFLSKKKMDGFLILHRQGAQQKAFYFTKNKSSKAPKGIRTGQAVATVLKKFGPPRYFFWQGGELMIYDSEGLFFKSEKGEVTAWGAWKND